MIREPSINLKQLVLVCDLARSSADRAPAEENPTREPDTTDQENEEEPKDKENFFVMTLKGVPSDFNINGNLPSRTKIHGELVNTDKSIRELLTTTRYDVDGETIASPFLEVEAVNKGGSMTIKLKGRNKA